MIWANADRETVHSAPWARSHCFKRKIPSIAPIDTFHRRHNSVDKTASRIKPPKVKFNDDILRQEGPELNAYETGTKLYQLSPEVPIDDLERNADCDETCGSEH